MPGFLSKLIPPPCRCPPPPPQPAGAAAKRNDPVCFQRRHHLRRQCSNNREAQLAYGGRLSRHPDSVRPNRPSPCRPSREQALREAATLRDSPRPDSERVTVSTGLDRWVLPSPRLQDRGRLCDWGVCCILPKRRPEDFYQLVGSLRRRAGVSASNTNEALHSPCLQV